MYATDTRSGPPKPRDPLACPSINQLPAIINAVHCLHRASSPRRCPSSLCAASRPRLPRCASSSRRTSSQRLLPAPPPSTSSPCLLLLTPLLLLPESGIDSVEEE
ncbi:unnamed protein product [Gadus morhua 'NCC']